METKEHIHSYVLSSILLYATGYFDNNDDNNYKIMRDTCKTFFLYNMTKKIEINNLR